MSSLGTLLRCARDGEFLAWDESLRYARRLFDSITLGELAKIAWVNAHRCVEEASPGLARNDASLWLDRQLEVEALWAAVFLLQRSGLVRRFDLDLWHIVSPSGVPMPPSVGSELGVWSMCGVAFEPVECRELRLDRDDVERCG